MNFLSVLLKAIIPAVLPTFLSWFAKQSGAWAKSIVNYFKDRSARKSVKTKKAVRENIIKRIEIATEKEDHEELEKLHVALHIVDSTD
jgi:ABC-type anion transport system duplicated permease subunit